MSSKRVLTLLAAAALVMAFIVSVLLDWPGWVMSTVVGGIVLLYGGLTAFLAKRQSR
jgi:4-hydroxybenzoate polyprenyltransferase